MSSIGRHIWSYPDVGRTGDSVQGYTVQATDGRVGKVDRAATSTDSHCLVVGTGTWIFGKKIVLPAGVIEAINDEQQEVWVSAHQGADLGGSGARARTRSATSSLVSGWVSTTAASS